MSASSSDLLSALDALSPVDGRYRAASAPLRGLLAEGGLIRERIRIEAQWVLHLAEAGPQLPGPQITPPVRLPARRARARTSACVRAGGGGGGGRQSDRGAHQSRRQGR